MTLFEVAQDLDPAAHRDVPPRRRRHGARSTAARGCSKNDPHWRDLILFYEYFHGDNGAGLGASHQTGWTGMVARLIQAQGALGSDDVRTESVPLGRVYRAPQAATDT